MAKTFRHAAAVVAVAESTVAALVHLAPAASAATPRVSEIPSTAGRGFAVSGSHGLIDFASRGDVEREFTMSGTASTYRQDGNRAENGRWRAVPAGAAPYTARMVVVRPNNPANSSGTVVIEWPNVIFGVDIPVDFSQSYEYFLRQGITYIGVTTQQVGARKLTEIDPARYAGVSIPDYAASYDILSQAAQAVRSTPAIRGGATPRTVPATGHSPSAMRLVTYANAIQPLHNAYDGIMVHGGPGGGARSTATPPACPRPGSATT